MLMRGFGEVVHGRVVADGMRVGIASPGCCG